LGRLFTYNQDLQTGRYDVYIDSLSRNLQRYQFTQTLRPELTYQINKETALSVNLGAQLVQIDNHFNRSFPDINQRNIYLLPALRFYNAKLSVNYSSRIRQPSISDLLPQTTFYSQLYSSVGNPDLKPTRSHNLNLSYYTYKSEKLINTNIYSGLTLEENSIFTQRTVSSEGATIARPVNKNGRYNTYLGANFGKGFKKFHNWQIRLNSRLSGGLDHNFFQVNNKEGYQNTSYLNFNQQFSINYNNKLDINPSYNLSPNITSYQNVEYNSVKYVTQSLDVPIVVRWPKHVVIEANYTYTYNPLVAAGFQRSINLLNLSVARLIQKRDRGEIKLSCYDLLNQNISAYRYATANTTVDAQNQILKRYLLLTYAYRFNKTITKK
ncbi:MAG: TonB-dependent receptor, partial [Sphingobacteriaceae bacterium]